MALIALIITADTSATPDIATILQAAAEEWMSGQTPPIVFTAMTTKQKVEAYAKGILMSVYVQRKTALTRATADASVATALTAATTAAQAGLA